MLPEMEAGAARFRAAELSGKLETWENPEMPGFEHVILAVPWTPEPLMLAMVTFDRGEGPELWADIVLEKGGFLHRFPRRPLTTENVIATVDALVGWYRAHLGVRRAP